MELTLEAAEAAAKQIWGQGYALFKIDKTLVEAIRILYPKFIDRRMHDKYVSRWCQRLPGEEEDDVGLVHGKEDLKWFFHDNPYLRKALEEARVYPSLVMADNDFLVANHNLYSYAASLGEQIVGALDDLYGLNIVNDYRRCCRQTIPYCTTTLRSLYYPDVPKQEGAEVHIDRSFLTIHFGDEGGGLYALAGPDDQTGTLVSPPPGYAIAFPGVKMLWPTEGRLKPLWHKSTTEIGKDRFAHVLFCHIEKELNGYVVDDVNEANRFYWQHVYPQLQAEATA